ncbi:MAG: hypothetical protein JNM27_17170 [Leptospirales bacterium]|nr:hypothetical protein [Leptospirales bacterium]
MKVRSLILLSIFSVGGLMARVPEKSVVVLPVKAVHVSPTGVETPFNAGLNLERGMRSILESRGTSVRSLPSAPVPASIDSETIGNLAKSAGADMVYVTEVRLMESEKPFGDLTAAFCGEASETLAARGKILLSIRAFSAAGKLLWSSESAEPYRCAEPVVEVWSQMMTALEKAPL